MADDPALVRPFYRLVANGIEGGRLKATLLISPELPKAGAPGFELKDWPHQMARLLKSVHLGAGGVAAGDAKLLPAIALQIFAGGTVETIQIKPSDISIAGRAAHDEASWKRVTALWKTSIEGAAKTSINGVANQTLAKVWEKLRGDIDASLTGAKHEAALSDTYSKPLGAAPDSFTSDGAMIARRPNPSDKIQVSGVVANKQGALAVDEEAVRAQRVLRKMVAGPGLPGDADDLPAGNTQDQSVPDDRYKGQTDAEKKKRFDEQIRQNHFDNFKQNVGGTDSSRKDSNTRFEDVKKLLKNTGGVAADLKTHQPGPSSAVVPAERVLKGEGRRELRAGHVYGGWLQTVKEGDRVADGKPYMATKSATLTAVEATALEQVRGVYYSFQGDYFLSRLFCFAADVTIKIPDHIKDAQNPLYIYLVAEGCDEARATTQTLTAARYDGKNFWPVSRFDVPGADSKAQALVEQQSGIWSLGGGYGDAHDPRYQLTSLDFRRAVDATTDTVDRGQRHITAGISVIDRGRGEQIARDLAISAVQMEKVCDQAQCTTDTRHCVVLWAEELTVGRRLDIAVVKQKSTVETLEWRGLMRRDVAFEVEAEVRKLLGLAVGQNNGGDYFHEETSFQVVTRTMPLLDDGDDVQPVRKVEAIADEALVMWDGTPLAALARHGTDQPVEPGTARLPFTRRHRLETSGSHRPPPLRYGAAYAFSMRSVFAGGGSPTTEMASAQHKATKGAKMLPPAITSNDGKTTPVRKRFLRHEGIDAPIALLPKGIAMSKSEAMGFEITDRVALRSATPSDHADLPDRYVALRDRLAPEMSARVFVAPMAALDTVVRHRKLDGEGGIEVMRGGLRDVDYDPANDGFPLAMTEEAAEFNGGVATVTRSIVRNPTNAKPEQKKRGLAVFASDRKNTAKSGETGYLPDPAAEKMVVRLRVRGSDRYLDGAWVTSLYDPRAGISYPHALPLVVSIEKLPRRRAKRAVACTDVFVGEATAIRTMDPNGNVRAVGAGVKVRHLTVRLGQGEDFDLEVVCLPEVATLAGMFALPETMAIQLAHATADACSADDLSCLCGPAATGRLSDIKNRMNAANPDKKTDGVGLGGWNAPTMLAITFVAGELIKTIESKWQVEELAAVQQVRVSHGINAPLTAATLVLPVKPEDRVTRPLVKKDDKVADLIKADSAQGALVSLLKGKVSLDLEQIDAFEIVVQAAGTGGKALDDKSRSRSLLARRSGRWPEILRNDVENGERRVRSHYVSTRDVLGFKVSGDGQVEFEREAVTLLRVDNLPDPRAAPQDDYFQPADRGLTEINLARLHAAGILKEPIKIPVGTAAPCPTQEMRTIVANTPVVFEDVRARKLAVKVVAVSRFSSLFESAPHYTDRKLLKRRQALAAGHQTISSPEQEIWIPATIRPPKCDVRAPTPKFVVGREAGQLCQKLTRTAKTRLHFGRGMFSSGEGERIGIVLWPPGYQEQNSDDMLNNKVSVGDRKMVLADLDDADLGPGGRFVTRWGGDPIRKDVAKQDGNFIPVIAFKDFERLDKGPHRPRYVAKARMPVRVHEEVNPETGEVVVDESEAPEFLEVSLLTYEPCFDLDREEWYVDVDLHPSVATNPFVRFGLVRYQPNSIAADLMMSEPVVVWTQLLPQRDVELTHSHKDGNVFVSATVSGQASIGTKEGTDEERKKVTLTKPQEKTLSDIQAPVMQMTLWHEGRTADNVLTRTLVPFDTPIKFDKNGYRDGLMRWTFKEDKEVKATWLAGLGKGALVAYIEEVERRMPATYASEPIDKNAILAEETIVSSGPRFNARIVFHVIS